MKTRLVTFNFKNREGDLCLTAATVFLDAHLPLALVHYTENGEESPIGIRIDVDKRAFIDNFEDPAHEAFAQSVAAKVAAEIYRQVYAPPADRRCRASSAHAD